MLNAMIHTIIDEGLVDETFIREFMDAIHRESIRRQTDGGVPVERSGTQRSDHSGLER